MIIHLKQWAADGLGHALSVRCNDPACWEDGDADLPLHQELLAIVEKSCQFKGDWCQGRIRIAKRLVPIAIDELENRLDIATSNIAYYTREGRRYGDADGGYRRRVHDYRNQAADIRHALAQLKPTENPNE